MVKSLPFVLIPFLSFLFWVIIQNNINSLIPSVSISFEFTLWVVVVCSILFLVCTLVLKIRLQSIWLQISSVSFEITALKLIFFLVLNHIKISQHSYSNISAVNQQEEETKEATKPKCSSPNPLNNCNIIQVITFGWFSPMMKLGTSFFL